jgi:hypothetical protein
MRLYSANAQQYITDLLIGENGFNLPTVIFRILDFSDLFQFAVKLTAIFNSTIGF